MSAPTVTLDALDAVELGEMLEFLHGLIGSHRLGAGESLELFTVAGGYTVDELRADLARFAILLGADRHGLVPGADR